MAGKLTLGENEGNLRVVRGLTAGKLPEGENWLAAGKLAVGETPGC
jgi:hypothetical protein